MPSPATQHAARNLLLPSRQPMGRNARIEQRIRRRMERERARERSGKVRLRTRGLTRAQLQSELPGKVMKWSRGRPFRIVDLIVPAVDAFEGVTFTAHGRVSSRGVVFVHCKVRRRWPLTCTTTIEFTIMAGLS